MTALLGRLLPFFAAIVCWSLISHAIVPGLPGSAVSILGGAVIGYLWPVRLLS